MCLGRDREVGLVVQAVDDEVVESGEDASAVYRLVVEALPLRHQLGPLRAQVGVGRAHVRRAGRVHVLEHVVERLAGLALGQLVERAQVGQLLALALAGGQTLHAPTYMVS